MVDEDDMMGWHVDDHCHDDLILLEYGCALAGDELKLACRGKETGRIIVFQLIMRPLHY